MDKIILTNVIGIRAAIKLQDRRQKYELQVSQL